MEGVGTSFLPRPDVLRVFLVGLVSHLVELSRTLFSLVPTVRKKAGHAAACVDMSGNFCE